MVRNMVNNEHSSYTKYKGGVENNLPSMPDLAFKVLDG